MIQIEGDVFVVEEGIFNGMFGIGLVGKHRVLLVGNFSQLGIHSTYCSNEFVEAGVKALFVLYGFALAITIPGESLDGICGTF